MFKNYFKTAWRSLVNQKLHATINIMGLSIGMTVAILIGIWIYDEMTFDKNFEHHERIAQVIQNVTNNGEVQTWWDVPYPLANELRTNYGQDFKHVVMGVNLEDHILTIGDKKIRDRGGFFEKEMPEMFTLTMLAGTRRALYEPSDVLISSSAAKTYFGETDPIGKLIIIDKMQPLKVAGIYKDFPDNSTFSKLNYIGSVDFWYHSNDELKGMPDPWRSNFTKLFVELNAHADPVIVSAKIKDAKYKNVNAQLQTKKPALFLMPMDKWHLYSEFKDGKNTGGMIRYVRMFAIIGIFVLLLACINFMNLSTARSEKRAKEVGIRKTIGSSRGQLIRQFFSESLLTVVIAYILSVFFAFISLPYFNIIAGKQMFILWSNTGFWITGVCFVVLTAIVSGSYPALYLSSFRPIKVLKGAFKASKSATIPRKILVVFQFTFSVSLIAGTFIVYQQIQYAKNRPVGYSRGNLVSIPTSNSNIHDHFEAVKAEVMNSGAVVSFAESESPTTGVWNSSSGFSWPGKPPGLSTDFGVVTSSFDYGRTIDWHVKEGRGFSRDFATDSSAIVLNEAAVRYMELKNPIGETVTWWDRPLKVIGVIENMVTESPYAESRPIAYTLLRYPGNIALLKLNPSSSASAALSKIESIFRKYNPDQPFEYKFVEDDYANKFGAEERIGKLAGIFTSLAVLISCLGLLGLTSFVAEQRKKEIGVRKVLGASVFSVWNLLSKDFITLVAASFIIAFPVSYYFMHGWLENYGYRTNISIWIFVVAGLSALLITLLTVSFQTIRAAFANPVKSLRSE